MAQTKRKRRSKHRGTAAGTIEARGRTGRRPSETERPSTGKGGAVAARARGHRLDRPPTWQAAIVRAALAGLFLLVVSLVALGRSIPQSITMSAFATLIYVPMGYYLDLFIYRRRTRPRPAK